MNTKIRKFLIVTWFITCLSILGSFLVSGSVLAQDEVRKNGEIAGGKSDSIPIQLKVGEMVEGEIIAVRNQRLRLSIADFTGKSIYYFGETSTRAGFYYAAKTDGQHYIVVANPNSFSAGTRGYNLTYTILPTDLAPGTGSGKAIGEKSIIPWIVTGVIISLVIFIRRRKEKRAVDSYMYSHYGRWQKYSIEQLEDEISRIVRKKRELEHRLDIFSKAAPKVVLDDYSSIESQMQDIKWELEELDSQEDDIRRVLRDKKAKQQRV